MAGKMQVSALEEHAIQMLFDVSSSFAEKLLLNRKRCFAERWVDFMEKEHQRMSDGEHTPTEKEIKDFIGEPAKRAQVELRRFLEENYDITPEMMFGGAKHGWEVRYRKSGKTLCTLTPEKGAVRVLIVLGKQESEKALSLRNELAPKCIS
jgi:hypothetical protein